MTRYHRDHVTIGDSTGTAGLKPKHLTKEEFGKRLYKLMIDRGWRQSDLARASGLPRDAVSTYIRGTVLPGAKNLAGLSKALKIAKEELLPNHIEGAIEADTPSFEVKVSNSAQGVAWLRVNRLVKTTTALKIAELLEADNVIADGARGSHAA